MNDKIIVMFWNLENFFDWTDTGKCASDCDFSSNGMRRWTSSRFYRKVDMVSKAILWTSDVYRRLPDVIGLCEIENRGVLYKLINSSSLRKFDYSIIHYDSPDKRGIDVALLYRKSIYTYVSSSRILPKINGAAMSTREILEVSLKHVITDSIHHYIVNHHPSKFGGGNSSDSRRHAAMRALYTMCDSLNSVDMSSSIIAMGDFNDDPSGNQFNLISDILVNKSEQLFKEGKGTIRFQGEWDLIDMFLVDKSIDKVSVMDIVQVPFLMIWDNSYPGIKPFRTYSGPRYLGGVSDHCPIVLTINIQ